MRPQDHPSRLEEIFYEQLRVKKMESELVGLQKENGNLKTVIAKQQKELKKLHKKCKKQ